jgi:hypothetical protein
MTRETFVQVGNFREVSIYEIILSIIQACVHNIAHDDSLTFLLLVSFLVSQFTLFA